VITTLSPTAAESGEKLVIVGTGFGAGAGVGDEFFFEHENKMIEIAKNNLNLIINKRLTVM